MPSWETLATQSEGLYTEDDFRSAAYQLVAQQILYASHPHQRKAQAIVSRFRRAFADVLDLLGMDLEIDDNYRFCAAIPRRMKHMPLPLTETLLMLVLRKIYHERALAGELDQGMVRISIEELQGSFQSATGRSLPTSSGELDRLITATSRMGATRKLDDVELGDQPFEIGILPGIAVLISEQTLHRLDAYWSGAPPRSTQEPASSPERDLSGKEHEAT